MKRRSWLSYGVTVLSVLLFVCPRVSALTVAPIKIELKGDPGKTVDGKFEMFNEQKTPITLYTTFQNFEANGEEGNPEFTDRKEDLATWIQTEKGFTLKPGQHVDVPFKITIPKNADPGGHFAAIFLGTTPPPATGGASVSLGAKTGILVLLTVSGDVKEGGGLLDFSTNGGQRFFNTLPVEFTYRFQNNGGDRIKPVGNITLKDTIWLTADKIDANKGGGNILPRSVRRFHVTWEGVKEKKGNSEEAETPDVSKQNESKNAMGRFLDTVRYQWDHFALGMYSARLQVTYGNDLASAQKSFIFFVLPWQLILVMLASFGLAFFVLRFGVRKYNAWIIRNANHPKKRA